MTNVPVVTFGPNGFIAPPDSAILAGVQADINAAFGGGVNPGLSTPQGQLASSEAAIISASYETFVYFTNQVDPAFAQGRMQDAIARIYFLFRIPPQSTVVQATCTGLAGVVIPTGALAQDTSGNLYTCTTGGTIPIGGSIVLPFTNNVFGPIACPEGTLTTIYQAIPGWDTIANLADGVLGNDVESRSAFEARRAQSVAANSRSSVQAIQGTVLQVSGVLDAYTIDNSSGAPVTIGGVTLGPNSLYCAAVGGTDAAVAQAIWSKKAPGCAYNGNTTVVVQDTSSGYNPPYPSYNVTFERPNPLEIIFQVNITNSPQVPANYLLLIQNAIINAFGGGDGGPRARIGSTIYASRFVAPVAMLGTWARIALLEIGSANTASWAGTASISGTTLTLASTTSGAMAIGLSLDDVTGNLIDGTTIISGSGSSWQVSATQTVALEAMTGSLANQNTVSVNINQVPVIVANNIAVNLV